MQGRENLTTIAKSVQKAMIKVISKPARDKRTGKTIHRTFTILPYVEKIHFQERNRIPMCTLYTIHIHTKYLIMNEKRKAEMLHEKHLNGNNNNNKKLVCTYYYISAAKKSHQMKCLEHIPYHLMY